MDTKTCSMCITETHINIFTRDIQNVKTVIVQRD